MPDPVTGAVLGAIGFTSGGIAKGSIAAGIQSVVYGANTGGAFSYVTSMAMTTGGAPVVPIILVGGAVAAGAGAAWSYSRKGKPGEKKEKEDDEEEEEGINPSAHSKKQK